MAQDWKPAAAPLMTRWGRAVTPENAHREYPRPTLVRKDWMSLNGLWQFAPAREGEAPPFGKDLPERILVPFPVESALSGIGRHEERMWYRRTFELRGARAGTRIILHVEAVDWEATVYVNRRPIGSHRGGYDRITLDITDALTPTGPQELIVGVWDPTDANWQPRGKQVLKPEAIWYTPSSGIWQTVWLEPVPEKHIRAVCTQPAPDGSSVRVFVDCRALDPTAPLSIDVFDGDTFVIGALGASGVEIPIRSPRWWTPDDPHLYTLKIAIPAEPGDDAFLDEATAYFALRRASIEAAPDGVPRVQLNGQPVFLIGPLDQGFWPDGLYTPPSDQAMIFDIESMKRLGFNTVRKHVKVEPERWYYHCDRLGLLVLQDMPSGDRYIGGRDPDIKRTPESAGQFLTELQRMIDDRGRHPSIISWVIFNEGWGQSDTAEYTQLVKHLDPTRLLIGASGWTDRGSGDILDLHTYPGPGPIPSHGEWGGRACILGEFGGLGLGIDGHTWQQKTWGYKGATDCDDLTFQYGELLRRLWDLKAQGLSGGIYTQLTDVETECNGLLTYDREVLKVDPERAGRAARGQFPRVEVIVPTSKDEPAEWRFRMHLPPADMFPSEAEWALPSVDDRDWTRGRGGFGTKGTPGAVARTEWNTPDIIIRREFDLTLWPTGQVALLIHHDEDAEVYLNGVLAAKVTGYTTDYTIVPILPDAAAALKAGRNILAIHCRQTRGGQYIDAGLVQLIEKEE